MGSRSRSRAYGLAFTSRHWTQSKSVTKDGIETVNPISSGLEETLSAGSEQMTDHTSGLPRGNNPVIHTKTEFSGRPYSFGWTCTNIAANGTKTYLRGNLWTGSGVFYQDSVTYPESTPSEGEIWERLQEVMEPAKAGLQFPVNLAEAAQTVALFTRPLRAFRDLRGSLKTIRRLNPMRSPEAIFARKLLRTMRTGSTKSVFVGAAKGVANGWLSWRYGYSQFLRDMRAIINVKQNIEGSLREEEARHSEPRRYSTNFVQTASVSPASVPSEGTFKHRTYGATSRQLRYTVVAVVSPPVGYHRVYRHIQRYFGLDRILGNALEVIPFSFVWDWFLPAGNLVNQLDKMVAGADSPRFHILRGSSSVKLLKDTSLVYSYKSGGNQPLKATWIRERKVTTTYTRAPWLPDTTSIDLSSRWTTTQKFDAAALAIQKLGRSGMGKGLY